MCRSLKGGIWRKLPLGAIPKSLKDSMPGGKGVYSNSMEEIIRAQQKPGFKIEDYTRSSDSPPSPNIHGDSPFMVKLQISALNLATNQSMMIYDRQRSFQLHFDRVESPQVFDEVWEEMKTKGVMGGLKMYRWARRTGDWELEVCVDRKPIDDIAW